MGSMKLSINSILVLLALVAISVDATNRDTCGAIVDNDDLFEGYTYSQHAVNWLEWTQSMVATESAHPLYETTGRLCTRNNLAPGNILMAGAAFGQVTAASGQVEAFTRKCRVSLEELTGGKPINGVFFPLLNSVNLETATMRAGSFSREDKLLTMFQRNKGFFLPCGKIVNNKCTNPGLGAAGAGDGAVANIKLKVDGKDMTHEVLKLPQTFSPWTPIYHIEGGLAEQEGDIDFDEVCNSRKSPTAKTQCFPGLFPGDDETRHRKDDNDGSDYRIYRDNGFTYGYYVMLDISECNQKPGSTFEFSFSADFVNPEDTTEIFFGFEEVKYKIKFDK